MRLRDLQEKLPWRSKYSDAFERGPKHRHFGHALHHVAKALGKLVELQDLLDHGAFNIGADPPNFRKYVADIVILAVRLANEFPGGELDLETAVRERVAEKNGVTLDESVVDQRFAEARELLERVAVAWKASAQGASARALLAKWDAADRGAR